MNKIFNRNYGKIIDGQLEYAYRPMEIKGEWHSNPSEELLLELGYKPIEYTEMPVKEGYYYTSSFEDEGDKIVQVWTEHEIPIEGDDNAEI